MNEELLRAIATTPVMSHKNFALYHAGETGNDFFDTDYFLSDEEVRSSLVNELVELVEDEYDVSSYDKIAFLDKDYGPVGTIIYASEIADEFSMDMVVIRVKDHLELRFDDLKVKGDLDEDDSVLIVDDVINTGGTQRRAMEIVEELGGIPEGVLCVFARNPQVLENMQEWDIGEVRNATSLFTHDSLVHLGLSLAEEPEDYFEVDFAERFVDILVEDVEQELANLEEGELKNEERVRQKLETVHEKAEALQRDMEETVDELLDEGKISEDDEGFRKLVENLYFNSVAFVNQEEIYG